MQLEQHLALYKPTAFAIPVIYINFLKLIIKPHTLLK